MPPTSINDSQPAFFSWLTIQQIARVCRDRCIARLKNSRGYLGLLSVGPDAQGQGHSRLLVAAVEDHCRNAGCSFLDITVVNVRSELFPFYAKLGFAAFDVLPFPVPELARQPLLLVRMTKPLVAPPQMALPA